MEELHRLWKYHANHLKEMGERNEQMDHQISNNNPKFEIDQLVMIKNQEHHTFEPKYLLDYRVLKYLMIAPPF